MKVLAFAKSANNGSFWVMFSGKATKQVKIAGKTISMVVPQFINIAEDPSKVFKLNQVITAAEAEALGLK